MVAKTQTGFEGVAFLQVAEREIVLDLLGDGVHAVFDCDVFHTLIFCLSVFCLFADFLSLISVRDDAQTPWRDYGRFDLK